MHACKPFLRTTISSVGLLKSFSSLDYKPYCASLTGWCVKQHSFGKVSTTGLCARESELAALLESQHPGILILQEDISLRRPTAATLGKRSPTFSMRRCPLWHAETIYTQSEDKSPAGTRPDAQFTIRILWSIVLACGPYQAAGEEQTGSDPYTVILDSVPSSRRTRIRWERQVSSSNDPSRTTQAGRPDHLTRSEYG